MGDWRQGSRIAVRMLLMGAEKDTGGRSGHMEKTEGNQELERTLGLLGFLAKLIGKERRAARAGLRPEAQAAFRVPTGAGEGAPGGGSWILHSPGASFLPPHLAWAAASPSSDLLP